MTGLGIADEDARAEGSSSMTSLVAGPVDLATAFMSKDRRAELREGELVKLLECGVFEVCDKDVLTRGSQWL